MSERPRTMTIHPEETCQQCGGKNVVWFAPNDIWNAVVGSESGLLCPVCFIGLADTKGLYQGGGWMITPERAAQDSSEQTIREQCAKITEDYGRTIPAARMFADRIAAAIMSGK